MMTMLKQNQNKKRTERGVNLSFFVFKEFESLFCIAPCCNTINAISQTWLSVYHHAAKR